MVQCEDNQSLATIEAHDTKMNGRIDWLALKEPYEGIGIHVFDIIETETILKIKADFFFHIKAEINIELTKTPMFMTYEQALATYCNEDNR